VCLFYHTKTTLSSQISSWPECLRDNLDYELQSDEEPVPVSTRPSWQPPSIHVAPSAFHDPDRGPMWISSSDTREYFGLGPPEILGRLSIVNGYNLIGEFVESTPQRPKYWLYHGWDLARDCQSRGPVDLALVRFRQKNRRREQEVWGRDGIRAALLNSSTSSCASCL